MSCARPRCPQPLPHRSSSFHYLPRCHPPVSRDNTVSRETAGSSVSRRSASKLPSPAKKKRPGGRWFETVVRPVGAEEDRQFFNAQASWAISCGEYVCRNTYNTPLVQGDRATRNTREA